MSEEKTVPVELTAAEIEVTIKALAAVRLYTEVGVATSAGWKLRDARRGITE